VVFLHNGILLATKKNEILSFTGKRIELETIFLSEVSQTQKSKSQFSPLYEDCKPKTNEAILWDMSHTKGRLFKGEKGQGKETKNLNEFDVFTVQK
jgi:hypothetical protein